MSTNRHHGGSNSRPYPRAAPFGSAVATTIDVFDNCRHSCYSDQFLVDLTYEAALELARQYIAKRYFPEMEMVIAEESPRETSFGWLFFYNTRAYFETRDIMKMTFGNGPLLIDRRTRALLPLPAG